MAIPKRYRYDVSGVMGSGCAINCVTGARSFGKTYGWKKQGIKRFLETGERWGYLRTFDQEIKDILADGPEAFFSDIMRNNEFPGYKFRLQGRVMQAGRIVKTVKDKNGEDKDEVEWSTMGQLLALSKAQNYKGKTQANMTLLVFDEFIRETRVPPYPADAVNKLYSLWETLDRRENRVKIVMLANAADVVNPYFAAWGIIPPELGQHCKVKVGDSYIYVENCWNNDFAKYADNSEIGKLTRGSSYASYAQANQFKNMTGACIKDRPRRLRPHINVLWGAEKYCIYLDEDDWGGMYVMKGTRSEAETFALMRDDMRPDRYVIERTHPILKEIVNRARIGKLSFPNDSIRERFGRILDMCGFH